MRISDWSSDVCSSDLAQLARAVIHVEIGLEIVIAGLGRDRIAVGPAVIEKVAVFALRRAGARGEIFVDIGQRAEQPLLFSTPQDEADRAFRPHAHGLEDARRLHHHGRSEEHTSELQSLMRISYAVFCLKKK